MLLCNAYAYLVFQLFFFRHVQPENAADIYNNVLFVRASRDKLLTKTVVSSREVVRMQLEKNKTKIVLASHACS